MPAPYIGITDFTSYGQVRSMIRVLEGFRSLNNFHQLHAGVMMSYKTLNGLETKWSKAFPPKERVSEIFSSSLSMNCLHYADYDGIDVYENLSKAIRYGGPGMNALQLDMVWPDPDEVRIATLNSCKRLDVILQVGKNAFDVVGNDPSKVVERIGNYKNFISYVLLDKSMGRGLGLDANGLVPYIREIKKAFPDLGIAVAGGLGPESLGLVEPLVKEFPDLSIDAQGRLRPSGSALDPIDWDMAKTYLIKALIMFQ